MAKEYMIIDYKSFGDDVEARNKAILDRFQKNFQSFVEKNEGDLIKRGHVTFMIYEYKSRKVLNLGFINHTNIQQSESLFYNPNICPKRYYTNEMESGIKNIIIQSLRTINIECGEFFNSTRGASSVAFGQDSYKIVIKASLTYKTNKNLEQILNNQKPIPTERACISFFNELENVLKTKAVSAVNFTVTEKMLSGKASGANNFSVEHHGDAHFLNEMLDILEERFGVVAKNQVELSTMKPKCLEARENPKTSIAEAAYKEYECMLEAKKVEEYLAAQRKK
jgi:hypothetical protein